MLPGVCFLLKKCLFDFLIVYDIIIGSKTILRIMQSGENMDIKKYIKNFVNYKYLLFELVKKNIKLKYRRSYLGILWTLVEPLLTMIVLTIVFGTLFGRDDRTYPVFILSGRLLFSFFSSSTKSGLKAISGNAAMIKKVYVPKYIYVISTIISNFITFLISLVVLVGVGAVLRVRPTIYMLQAVIPIIILLVMSLGIGLILATMDVFFRDIEYIWSVVTMLIMYASAIFYSTDRVASTGNAWIFDINPVYMCIANFRRAVLYGQPMDLSYFAKSSAIAVVFIIAGTIMFYKNQDKFILHV